MSEMYKYLEQHAYISENKKSNYQFELSKERAEAIANKCDNLLQQKENIIKEVRETLNNKRTIMTTQLLNGSYCNYEELLYQVDEEIRKILDKGDSNE